MCTISNRTFFSCGHEDETTVTSAELILTIQLSVQILQVYDLVN